VKALFPARRVHIAGTSFKVTTSKKRLREASQELGPIKGFSFFDKALIGIDATYPVESQKLTFLHEIIHMALVEGGVRLAELLKEVGNDPEELEERIVRGLTGPMLAFIRRNPIVLEWLADSGSYHK